LIVTLLFLVMAFIRFDFLDEIGCKIYDLMMRLTSQPEESSRIVVVEIDDESVEKPGRWFWARDLIAKCLKKIDDGSLRAVGLNIILSEPENSAGLEEIRKLEDFFSRTVYTATAESSALFLEAMGEAKKRLDHDAALARSISETRNVVLPVFFKGARVADTGQDYPSGLSISQTLQNVRRPSGLQIPRAAEITTPIAAFFEAAAGRERFMGVVYLGKDPRISGGVKSATKAGARP
jgi:CHASE2 domain-containing sensor protein